MAASFVALVPEIAFAQSPWPAATQFQPPAQARQRPQRNRGAPARPVLRPTLSTAPRPRPATGNQEEAPETASFRASTFDANRPRSTRQSAPPPPAFARDNRAPEDDAPFEEPPAGADPRRFQVEPVPLLDRRPRLLFEFEPYAHLGYRLGSFVLLQEIEVAGVHHSNVFASSRARSDQAIDIRSDMRLVSNWRRHAVEFRVNGGLNFFKRFADENDTNSTLEARGRLDITRRTRISALIARDQEPEERSSIEVGTGVTDRATITTHRGAVTLDHRFNRLSVQLRGARTDEDVGPSSSPAGTSTNRDRDVETTEGVVRVAWEFRPTFFVFGEFSANRRGYDVAAESDGILRSSDGRRYRTGVSFGNTGTHLRGEFSIGYGIQLPDDERLRDYDAFLFDANVAWRLTPMTSLLLDARTAFTETTLVGSPGAVDHTIGLGVRHAFRRNIIANAGVSYTTLDYAESELEEKDVTVRSGVEYSLNRHLMLFGRFEHVTFWSTDESRNYNADEFRIGARWRN